MQTRDAKMDALEQEVGKLNELLRAMLKELMTGRLSAHPLVESKKEAAVTA